MKRLGGQNWLMKKRQFTKMAIISAFVVFLVVAQFLQFLSNSHIDFRDKVTFPMVGDMPRARHAITVTMTTCNRLRLTQESLRSFFQFNGNVHIKAFKIVVDCFNSSFAEAISQEFPDIEHISPITNSTVPATRMMDNIQLLFTHVLHEGTDYWVHLEDDWIFVSPNFIVDGIKVLDSVGQKSNIWMVVGREPNTFSPLVNDTFGWKNASDEYSLEREYGVLNIKAGPGGRYCSYTSNPAVLRVHTAKEWGIDLSKHSHEAFFSLDLAEKHDARVAIFRKYRYYHAGGKSTTMKHKVRINEDGSTYVMAPVPSEDQKQVTDSAVLKPSKNNQQEEMMASQAGILPMNYDATDEKILDIMMKSNKTHVPNVFHFVWVYVKWDEPLEQPPVPPNVLERVDTWKKLHPTWHIIIWTNAGFLRHFPQVYEAMSDSGIRAPAWASDIMRYYVLSRYGGLYLDTDILPLHMVPPRMLDSPFTVCEEPRSFDPSSTSSPPCKFACNAVIASPPGNSELINVAIKAVNKTKAWVKEHGKEARYNHYLTGPPHWSKTATLPSSTFKLLPPKLFYPCNYDNTTQCIKENFVNNTEVIAMHLWEHSWW